MDDNATFARHVAIGLADAGAGDLDEGLTPLLLLSLWMRRASVDPMQACQSMLALRHALLDASEIDESQEPIPLVTGDHANRLLCLALYLDDLMTRASVRSPLTRDLLAAKALELLAA